MLLSLIPFLLSIILYLIKEEKDIIYYGLISLILININNIFITSEIIIIIILTFILLYWISFNQNEILAMIFLFGSILGLLATSIFSFFIAIEMLSFTMIIIINLYIQDQYPGIIYYLLSGILSALSILSIGYIYIGYEIGYKIFYIVLIGKLGLVPFHILLINIYNNISLNVLLFIDVPYKFILFIFLYKIYWISINLMWIIMLCIIIGSIGSLYYNNLLSILIYSSLFHYGLILSILTYQNWEYFIYYLIIYIIMVILFLYLLTSKWIDFKILHNYYLFIWFLLIFNFIGIPPFQGFLIKFYTIYLLLLESNFILFIIITIGVLLLSYTYIRILLSMMINHKSIIIIHNSNPIMSHILSFFILFITIPLFL